MKGIKHGIEGCDSKLFIVYPTLKMLLENHPNPKELVTKAKMEYSNFIKSCKMERDMLFSSYIKCMNAYDRDIVLLSVPKSIVEAETSPKHNNGDWYYTITQEELIQIVRRLYMQIFEMRGHGYVLWHDSSADNNKFGPAYPWGNVKTLLGCLLRTFSLPYKKLTMIASLRKPRGYANSSARYIVRLRGCCFLHSRREEIAIRISWKVSRKM